METDPFVSLVIPVYYNQAYLRLIIQSIKKQSYRNFELILSEDADSAWMAEWIAVNTRDCDFPVVHVCQPDHGYRRAAALNNACRVARGKLLVVSDSDCILHPHYLLNYARAYSEGECFVGRRVSLGPMLTTKLIQHNKVNLRFFDMIFSDANKKELKEAIYLFGIRRPVKSIALLGSNFGVKKNWFEYVNGVDEDYQGYGLEDCDLDRRLQLAGARFVSMKCRAIQYHLWHSQRQTEPGNKQRFQVKCAHGEFICKNGLDKQDDSNGQTCSHCS